MSYRPDYIHILDFLPGVIKSTEELFSKTQIGNTVFISETSSGKPAGFGKYRILSKILPSYKDHDWPGILFEHYSSPYRKDWVKDYRSINDLFNDQTKRIFLTRRDAEHFQDIATKLFNSDPEWQEQYQWRHECLTDISDYDDFVEYEEEDY